MEQRSHKGLAVMPGHTFLPNIDIESHMAAIVNLSDDPIIGKDLSGTIVSWNPAASRVFGYSPDEILGESMLRLIPSELRQEEEEIVGKISAGGQIDRYETIRLHKNGDRVPVSLTVWAIRDLSGKVVGASNILRDISTRRENERSRFHLAAIVDSAEDAIISKDLNGIISTWNNGATTMYGYTPDEIIGKSILTLIPDDLQHEEDDILRKIRAGERIEHYETIRVRKNGKRLQVSVTISPIRDETGRIIGASKIARDISNRKRLEQLLIESEKIAATGRMAASIAHEINNPLESVLNLIYLARQGTPEQSKAHEYLATAEQEIERVSHIARQTLGYYRDTGLPVALSLDDLLGNVLTVYQAKIITMGIFVERFLDRPREVVARKGEILQVFSNVIANAIEAMPNGGTLRITTHTVTRAAGEGAEVLIEDSGTGIAAEHLERVFEPFFTTKGDIGTGIGLWVARQLLGKRGGDIQISSTTEKKNHGTKVNIFIPFDSSAE